MPFVTGADVQSAKTRLNPSFIQTNAAITSCSNAPKASVTAWTQFFSSWQSFFAEDENTVSHELSAGGRMDMTEQYGKDLLAWQNLLPTWNCNQPGPKVTPTTNQTPPIIGYGKEAAQSEIGVLEAVALVGVIGIIGYVVVTKG